MGVWESERCVSGSKVGVWDSGGCVSGSKVGLWGERRSGDPEPVLTNPSYGVTVSSVGRAGGSCGWTSGGEVCVTMGWQGHYTV